MHVLLQTVTPAVLLIAALITMARFWAGRERRKSRDEIRALKLEFLGMISHELRTPLTSIKGFATTLLADDVEFPPEMQREFLGIIDTEADRLADLIDNLLDLNLLQTGTLTLNIKTQRLQDVLNNIAPRLHTLTCAHRLVVDVPPDFPMLAIDGARVGQILLHLIGNAARFSPVDSTITLRAVLKENKAAITVSDQGSGIPPDVLDSVFEAFWQGKRKKSQEIKGAGLGLAICKGLIEAHGGGIGVESQPTGTSVMFTLNVSP